MTEHILPKFSEPYALKLLVGSENVWGAKTVETYSTCKQSLVSICPVHSSHFSIVTIFAACCSIRDQLIRYTTQRLHRTVVLYCVFLLKVILVPMPFVLLLLLFETCNLILSELLLLYLPINVFSKLTISSLSFTNHCTSHPHQRLRFYFFTLAHKNLHYFLFTIIIIIYYYYYCY